MEGGWAFRETRLGCCPGRGGGRYSTIGGNFAANSLYMKNLRLRMNPQVWVRRAKAEAWTPKAAMRLSTMTRPLCGFERIIAPRRERRVQLDLAVCLPRRAAGGVDRSERGA